MDEYKKNYPELFDTIIQAIGQKIENDIYIDKNIYEKYEDIAFDKLVMEKTDNGIIIPFHGSWSDIGSWDSLAKIYLTDDLAPEQGSEAISPHIADDIDYYDMDYDMEHEHMNPYVPAEFIYYI